MLRDDSGNIRPQLPSNKDDQIIVFVANYFSPPRTWRWFLCVLLFAIGGEAATVSPARDTNSPTGQALQTASKLFQEQHWAEARSAYDAARGLEHDWTSPAVRLAVEGAVGCSLKLSQWDEALSRAADFVARTKG